MTEVVPFKLETAFIIKNKTFTTPVYIKTLILFLFFLAKVDSKQDRKHCKQFCNAVIKQVAPVDLCILH